MILCVDYTDRIDPSALVAAGVQYVSRYLSEPGWPKNITAAEAAELHAAGIGIVLNYETTADFMLTGYRGGTAVAASARAQATDLGAPHATKLWYSADFDASTVDVQTLEAFLRGAANVDGMAEVGEYGGLRAVTAAGDDGFAEWQTAAWSGGRWDPRAVMRQTGRQMVIHGSTVDVNEVINEAGLGAWMPPGQDGGDMAATFATVEINKGTGAVTMVCPPPANIGVNWKNVWFSIGTDFGDGDFRVAAMHPNGVWEVLDHVHVPHAGLRVNPWGGPLPQGIQKISITRNSGSENVPAACLIEAAC